MWAGADTREAPERVLRGLSAVEVAGIEPASSGGLTGLLRAQLVASLLGPTGLQSKPV